MKKIAIILVMGLLLALTVQAQQEKLFSVTFTLVDNQLVVEDVEIVYGVFVEPKSVSEDYRLELLSFEEKVLYETKFGISTIEYFEPLPEWFDEEGNQIYIPSEDEVRRQIENPSTAFLLPYFPDVKFLRVYDSEGVLLLEEDISFFADSCGNNICDPHESMFNCRQDCQSGVADDVCDGLLDGVCDPDCAVENDDDCKATSVLSSDNLLSSNHLLIIVGVIVVVSAILFIRTNTKKIRKKRK
jgi:hypothetical protein